MSVERLTTDTLRRWVDERTRFAAAMLVEVIGSAPLDPGAIMLIDEQGRIEGSVTGGCVEGALVEEAIGVLAGGPPRLVTYGISDEVAGGVGLMCGGTVRILVHEIAGETADTWLEALTAVDEGRPGALATVLTGPLTGATLGVLEGRKLGSLGLPLLEHGVERDAGAAMAQGLSTLRRYGSDGTVMGSELEVFIRAFGARPRMVIVGAVDFSAALARFARELGFDVTICDARGPFLQSRRFTSVADVVQQWPHEYVASQVLGERDVVLVFSHDSKFDEPALQAALATDAGYIGAMGSRKTQADRTERLRAVGVTQAELERIASPCGLDIGAASPAETAVSILAEVIALRTGRGADRLSDTSGSIRSRTQATEV
ncbi:MAG: xanthine dehydrogenase accessory factor [Thermoleophilaceae bacterium]|nr:xanthine dehydrogenase accessory factor [Thermoleophilaceae bacterium]